MKLFSELKKNLKSDFSNLIPVKVALLGDTATQFLSVALRGTGFDEGINLQIFEADFNQLERSTRTSYLVRNIFSTRLLPNFRLPRFATLALASRSDYFSPEFQKEFPHNQGLIALSGVGFNRTRTQAMFYVDHFCGLCGGGRYVLMAKIDGAWHVREEHSTWIS